VSSFLFKVKYSHSSCKKTFFFLYFLLFLSLQWIWLRMKAFINIKWILVWIFNWIVKFLNDVYCMIMMRFVWNWDHTSRIMYEYLFDFCIMYWFLCYNIGWWQADERVHYTSWPVVDTWYWMSWTYHNSYS